MMGPNDQNGAVEKPKVRKITPQDIEAIAQFVSEERLNESEACHQLNIKPHQWFVYKSRAKRTAKFETICARIRGATISEAMRNVKAAGKRDFRAELARLAIIDKQRFGQQSDAPVSVVNNLMGDDAIAKVLAMYRKSKESVIDVESSPVKQIESTHQD